MVSATSDVYGKASSRVKLDVDYFVKVITVAALIQAVIVFSIGVGRGQSILQAFVYSFIGI